MVRVTVYLDDYCEEIEVKENEEDQGSSSQLSTLADAKVPLLRGLNANAEQRTRLETCCLHATWTMFFHT